MSHELILIVDQDTDLVAHISRHLEEGGYHVRTASDGRTALNLSMSIKPRLVLLEMALPDISGVEICRRLRGSTELMSCPVVFITDRNKEDDRIAGFEAGATDYVIKPFSIRELLLRVRAIMRRKLVVTERQVFEIGPLQVDLPRFQATVDREAIPLTRQEFVILSILARRCGRVFSREQLIAEGWNGAADVLERTVDVHIKSMRRKLGNAAALIETVHGVGYRIRAKQTPLRQQRPTGGSHVNEMLGKLNHPDTECI